jgi:23S rRNA (uridine2552-2'-O)-methyltransferase
MTEDATVDRLRETVGEAGVDVVVSDMAPNMTGEYSVDHARSVHLARQAFDVARDLLAPGGDLVVKVFDGPDLDDLRAEMEEAFEYVRTIHPDASRDASSELYLVAKRHLTAPVEVGEERSVEIVDRGSEGDGIARIEGFTVFVPDVEVGDRVDVRIDDVKARFAFAEPLD